MKKLIGLAIVGSVAAMVACSSDDSASTAPNTGCPAGTEPQYDMATGALLGCNPAGAASSSDMALAGSSSDAAVAASSSSQTGLTPIAASSSSDAALVAASSSSVVAAPASSSVAAPASSSAPASSAAKTTTPDTPAAGTPALGLWDAADGTSQVPTGDKKGGYWYDYNDEGSKGASTLTWQGTVGSEYSDTDLAPVVKECGGLCAEFSLVKGGNDWDPFVGFGFDMTDGGETVVDATSSQGICVTYTSTHDLILMIGLSKADEDKIGSNNPAVILKASSTAKTVNAKWSEFDVQWATSDPTIEGPAAAKKMKGIKFQVKDETGTTGSFKITQVGGYDLCK